MNSVFLPRSISPSAGATASDDRRLARDRTAMACTIVHGMFRERQAGVVRDIHEHGARIRPSASPQTFQGGVELIVEDQVFRGEVVGRSRTEMGIRFSIADPLASQAPAKP